MSDGEMWPIPERFMVPTCGMCGEHFVNRELGDAIDNAFAQHERDAQLKGKS